MIYTVTFNPSLDYIVRLPSLALGGVNRTEKEELYPGGKGINVSIMLRNLGVESTALGFIAGFTGTEISRLLDQNGCRTDFIRIADGFSRINVKIKAEQESEINGQGPHISPADLSALYQKLDQLNENDLLVLAGSIPNTLPPDVYEKILERLQNRNIHAVVDATGDLLKNVLKYRPFLIKPNNHELGELFGKVLETDEELILHAKKLQEQGARNVLISMAGSGAILVDENGSICKSLPPSGKVANSVGAGDSMVAGFLAGYLQSGDYGTAFKTGLAAGSASAFQEWLASGNDVRTLLQTL
ncbi:1-phosphofructokinase [Clostridium sp. D33t1_170424_F3]|uniref:1-phosphofructokinase n=1 Tax=Clostridium sp. D33t1_170424_F3 TaxID=2787099 RepID=UPI0018AB0F5A|nr:1-phosphofructokinase [Clostridium sp. D33t1_170424_F3]